MKITEKKFDEIVNDFVVYADFAFKGLAYVSDNNTEYASITYSTVERPEMLLDSRDNKTEQTHNIANEIALMKDFTMSNYPQVKKIMFWFFRKGIEDFTDNVVTVVLTMSNGRNRTKVQHF